MKIALTADWHARGKDLHAFEAQLGALVDTCRARSVQHLCIAGDIADSPSVGDTQASTGRITCAIKQPLEQLTNTGCEVHIIPGNHDQAGAGSADALHVLDGMPGIYTYRQPDSVFLADDTVLAFVPWDWNPDACAEDVITRTCSEVQRCGSPVILLAHVQVIGARMQGNFTCESKPQGWQISRACLDALPVDHIALGDFHRRQELVPGRGGYIGALRQLNHGESGNPAGFEIYDTDTKTVEWLELDAAPRHYTVQIDTQGNKQEPEGIRETDKVRVRYETGGLDHADVLALERQGRQVEEIYEPEERQVRAEVPEGILADKRALLDLWLSTQDPALFPVERQRLAHDELNRLLSQNDTESEKAA